MSVDAVALAFAAASEEVGRILRGLASAASWKWLLMHLQNVRDMATKICLHYIPGLEADASDAAYAAEIEEVVVEAGAGTRSGWLYRSLARDVRGADASLAILISSALCSASMEGHS